MRRGVATCFVAGLVFLWGGPAFAYPGTIATSAFVSIDAVHRAMAEASSSQKKKVLMRSCRAGVVNHHVLAADLIGAFVEEIRGCHNLKRVIILSPDHYQAAASPVVTHRSAYEVGGTSESVDEEGVQRLLKTVSFAREDDRPYWQAEHGVGALVPFLAQVSTSTKILPVVVRGTITPAQSKQLSRWLASEMKRGAFVLVSSDMSHYLQERQALMNDKKTLSALGREDARFFARANDGYTDNGKSIAAIMTALGRTSWRLIGRGISTTYGGVPGYTTSYVTGVWR